MTLHQCLLLQYARVEFQCLFIQCLLLQYARDQFEGLFTQTPATAKQYIEDDRFLERTMKLPGTQPVRADRTIVMLSVSFSSQHR